MRDFNNRARDSINLQLDNRQVVSFVIGSLVVLGVVFTLGVLVGKQLAVDALPKAAQTDALTAIDNAEARVQQPAPSPVGTGELKPAEPAAEEKAPEAAAAKAEQKPADKVADKDAAPAPEKPLTFAAELTKPKVDPVLEPARPTEKKDVKAEKKPEPQAEERALAKEEKPASRKESLTAAFDKAGAKSAAGDFTLQVSSFPDRGGADKLAQKLKGKGYEAFVAEAEVPGKGRFYRVKVGAFPSRNEADAALKSFKAKTSLQAFVTQ